MSKYMPFKLLKLGEKFRDLDTQALFMKIGVTMHDTGEVRLPFVHLNGGCFDAKRVDCAAMEPFVYKNNQYSVGDCLRMEDNEAVVVVDDDDGSEEASIRIKTHLKQMREKYPLEFDEVVRETDPVVDELRRERDVCAKALREIHQASYDLLSKDVEHIENTRVVLMSITALREAGSTTCA